jgi:hypothetical protein
MVNAAQKHEKVGAVTLKFTIMIIRVETMLLAMLVKHSICI